MKSIAFALFSVFSLPALAVEPLNGTWLVTSTETINTCPVPESGKPPAKLISEVWETKTNEDGSITATVQGAALPNGMSAPPIEKSKATFTGYAFVESKGFSGYFGNTTWISLDVKATELTGIRRVMQVIEVKTPGKRLKVPCFIDMTVVAKRQ